MDPINYNQDVATPFQSVLQGFQAGAGMDQIAQQQQLQQQQIQQQQQMRVDMAALASKQNPTGQDYAALMTKYPAMADHFKKSWDVMNSQQQQNKLGQATQVHAALLQNQPEIASQLLLDQAKAARNSGNEQDAAGAETMAKLIGINPQAAKTSVALWLSSAMGPEKYATTFGTLGDQQRAQEKQPTEIKKLTAETDNLTSQIDTRAGQLNLDRDKLTTETNLKLYELGLNQNKLDDGAKKIINESTVSAVAGRQAAAQMNDLAGQFLKADPVALGAGTYEWLKKTTGQQNYISNLRREYDRVTNKEVIGSLPPGPASDRDIMLAREGFLKSTANPQEVASFLRGMSKLQAYNAQLDDAKAEWVNSVGHLGRAKNDIRIGDAQIAAGTTFSEYVQRALKPIGAQTQPAGRSYMRFAQPGAQ